MDYLRLRFFPGGAEGPVRRFLERLSKDRPDAYVKLMLDLRVLGAEGLRSGRLVLRPMGGGLWEFKRAFEGMQYRVLLCVERGVVWLLHAFEKKRAKAPLDDLSLARKRMKDIRR